MSDVKKGSMKIGGKAYPTKETELPHTQLRFYVKNPRVYSELVIDDDHLPSQEEIEEHMTSSDRAKELKEMIKANNGLINAVIVRDKDYSVLEGNTRLAAYRILAKTEPHNPEWKKMKCIILPANISDDAVNILLASYHIKGRKDWDPYEQAGHLYRWKKESKLPTASMAKQLGLTKGTVENMINVFSFMKKHNDLSKSNWSYYEEYLKNAGIKKIRESKPELDIVFVNQVLTNKIPSAQYVRKLGEMGNKKGKEVRKVINAIISEDMTIKEGYDSLADNGEFDSCVKKLEKFRSVISTDNFEKQMRELKGSAKSDAIFAINKINKRLTRIMEKMKR